MITKKHIRKFLDGLSSDMPASEPRLSDHIWQQLHEYLVKHYKRLDKEALAYADEIFDQLDASLKQQITSLPEGPEKRTLSRKFAMIRGERSPLPILYLDTPVVESFIRQGLGHPPFYPEEANMKALYDEVLRLVKGASLICPENTFHREALQMGGPEAIKGLNIMRRLSEELSFKHNQTIEDAQVFRAIRGFIEANGQVNFRRFWKDAFEQRTVRTIMSKRPSIVFTGVLGSAGGANGTDNHKTGSGPFSTTLRIRYDENALKDEQQLQKRSARHLRELVRLGIRYQSIRKEGEKRHLDGFWAGQKPELPVALWSYCKGKPEGLEGLVAFYESEIFGDIPAMRNKQDIWNAFSENRPEGLTRVTGPPDISILSSVLPYTDMVILGSKMAAIVRDTLHLDERFDTEVYGMNEPDRIMAALKEIASSD